MKKMNWLMVLVASLALTAEAKFSRTAYITEKTGPGTTLAGNTVYTMEYDCTVTATAAGQSAFYVNPNSMTAICIPKGMTLTLVGRYDASIPEVTVESGSAKSPGYTLLGAPSVTAYDFNSVEGAGADDQIIVPGDVPKVYTYENGAWGYWKTVETTFSFGGVEQKAVRSVWTTDESSIAPRHRLHLRQQERQRRPGAVIRASRG